MIDQWDGWMLALTISKHKTIDIQENYEILLHK